MASASAAALQLLQEFQRVQGRRAELYTQLSAGFRDFLDHGQEGVFARLMQQQITPGFSAVSRQVIAIETNLRSSAVGRQDLAGLLRQVQELEREKLRLTLSWQALRAAHAAGRFSWQSEADRPRLNATHSQSGRQQQQQQQQQVLTMLEQVKQQAARQQIAQHGGCSPASNDAAVYSNGQHQEDGFMSVKPGFYEQQMQRAIAAAELASAGESSSQGHSSQQHDQGQGCCMGHGHSHEHMPPDPLEGNGTEPTEAEYNAAIREAVQELDRCVLGINEVLEEVREAMQELQD